MERCGTWRRPRRALPARTPPLAVAAAAGAAVWCVLLAQLPSLLSGQYIVIERKTSTPHLLARIPQLAAREYPGGVVATISAIYEVDTADFETMILDVIERIAFALGGVPLQYLELNSFKWLTAGHRCDFGRLACYKPGFVGTKMLAPGYGGALPRAYVGNLADVDPRYCKSADGQVVPANPGNALTGETLPTEFDPEWDHLDPNKDRDLLALIETIQLCVHKANTSLQYYPIVIPNVFITGVRDNRNTHVYQDPKQPDIQLLLWIVGVIPITWAKFFNRKFLLNGSIPLPMYQPEVVDRNATHTRNLNVSIPILSVVKAYRTAADGGTILEPDLPVCKDPKIAAAGCVQMNVNYYLHPNWPEYSLRDEVEWGRDNYTRLGSEQPYSEGTFNISQGPWPVVNWIGPRDEDTPGPWSQRTFPQKLASKFRQECKTGDTCWDIPAAPPMRHLHTAVLYSTWKFQEQAWKYLCNEKPQCGSDCLANLTCLGGDKYFQENFFLRSAFFRYDDGGIIPPVDLQYSDCPNNCCQDRRLCMRVYDVLGYEVPYDSEMMLVFGGKGYIHEKDPVTGKLIYHSCERIPTERILKDWRSCMETVLDDLWRYNLLSGKWEYIKADSAISITTGDKMGYPLARYGHGAVLIEEVDGADPNFKRLYMYIYGGLGPQCTNGGVCNDVWKYEIPFAPQAYYPKFPDGPWLRGNIWTRLKDNPFGGRYRHAMSVTSGMEYIYVYGGQVIGKFENTLMRYRISTDMWEDVDPFGKISLTRMFYDYRGNQVVLEAPLDEYNPDIDVDCTTAWRFDGKWSHCRVCADCRLLTGTRSKGAQLPEDRADMSVVTFRDLAPGAVEDSVAIFGGYRTSWGTLRDEKADCAAEVTTTTTTAAFEEVILNDNSYGVGPLTTPRVTTTTMPQEGGVQLIGTFPPIGPTDPPTTTTTTLLYQTTTTTTQLILVETMTSTTTSTSVTRTRTSTTTKTSTTTTFVGTTTRTKTTTTRPPFTFPPVVAGTAWTFTTNSSFKVASAGNSGQSRMGPEACANSQQYYFDDLWVYEATTNQLFEHAVTGDPPQARRGHGMIARNAQSDDSQLVLFGGHNQDEIFGDMWIMNVMRGKDDRRWARIDLYFEGPRPPALAYHTMLYSERSRSIIVFGGLHWGMTDLHSSDALRNIDRRCFKRAQGMVQEEAGKSEADFLHMLRAACAESDFCCDLAAIAVPPVYFAGSRIRTAGGALNLTAISMHCRKGCEERAFKPEFYPTMSEGIWLFQTDSCPGNCSGHGSCDMSQCICMPDYYGIDCSQRRCPGSPCYTDQRTKEQFCMDCSGHGRCIDGECQCSPGWGFADCAALLCEDNCSSTPTETRGICVEDFPMHQCVCTGRYSGRKCEQLLCLNGCSGRGECMTNGTCTCEAGFHGEDCSVFTFEVK